MGWIDSSKFRVNQHVINFADIIAQEAVQCWQDQRFTAHHQSRESNVPGLKIANKWYQFDLRSSKDWHPLALQHAPQTIAALNPFKGQIFLAFGGRCYFSCVPPHAKVEPHVGCAKIRNHLPLLLPDHKNSSWMIVGGEKRHWKMGQTLTFDDRVLHSVENNSHQIRIVLIYDIPLDAV
jgi:aspartate beta-hydroxylase